MSKVSFDENPLVRKWMRYFLALQIGALVVVFVLILLKLHSLALALSFVTFAIFVGVIVWLFLSYTNHPLVQEKRTTQQRADQLQTGIQSQNRVIQSVEKKRGELIQAKQDEIISTVKNLQRDYIQSGLKANHIINATISGVGTKLKERLAEHGIASAFDMGVFHLS